MDISKILSGTVDAKAEVLDMLKNMSPAQRQAARRILPQVEKVAQQTGISSGNFISEINAHLQ